MNDPVTLYSGDPMDMLSCATIQRVLEWHEAFDERITGNERREIALHQLRLDDVRDLGQWVLNGLRQYGAAWAQREKSCHPKHEMRSKCNVHGDNPSTSGSSPQPSRHSTTSESTDPISGDIADSAEESRQSWPSVEPSQRGSASSQETAHASPSPPMPRPTTKREPPSRGPAPSPDDADDLPF